MCVIVIKMCFLHSYCVAYISFSRTKLHIMWENARAFTVCAVVHWQALSLIQKRKRQVFYSTNQTKKKKRDKIEKVNTGNEAQAELQCSLSTPPVCQATDPHPHHNRDLTSQCTKIFCTQPLVRVVLCSLCMYADWRFMTCTCELF